MDKPIAWYCPLGLIPYPQAWAWQRQLVAQRRHNPDLPDVLLTLQHPPIYTLGQGATTEHVQFAPESSAIPVLRVERGGEVTYHCPGQLVAYPILNLRRHRCDLHWYLHQLEEVIIQTLRLYNITGVRLAGLTGVWVEGYKVAAIGIKVSRWLSFHGLALNVTNDLRGFGQIVPCGIGDRPVGNLLQFRPDIDLESVRQQLSQSFARVFNLHLEARSLGEILETTPMF
ncbi:lipoyl(octanoyl) transferase LipB [Thermosynechococcaceae cyanobacterium Okahandja]